MKEREKSTHHVNGTCTPLGPGGEEMNHQSHGGFVTIGTDNPPIQPYAPAFDAGGIGVAVVVHLPLPGPVLHRRRRSNLADIVHYSPILWLLANTMKTTTTNALHIARIYIFYDGFCCWNVMARLGGIYNRSSDKIIGNVQFASARVRCRPTSFYKTNQAKRINTTINKYRARIMNGYLVYGAI